MGILDDISSLLPRGKAADLKVAVQSALDQGLEANAILEGGLMAGMAIIGAKFKVNEVYVPEVLIAARAMNAGLEPLKPHLVSQGVKSRGTVVIGTVKGDLHDIGKNLVRMMLEGKGLTVVDLGVDVPVAKFVAAVQTHHADILCLSALLTTTMMEMRNVIEGIKTAGLREHLVIMVGGAPITDSFRESIGADLYSPDAASAAEAASAALSKAPNVSRRRRRRPRP